MLLLAAALRSIITDIAWKFKLWTCKVA